LRRAPKPHPARGTGAYEVLQDAIPGATVGYTTRDGIVDCYRPHIEHGAIRVF
jgi:hypothetical protein